MDTWNRRKPVVDALQAAGWEGPGGQPFALILNDPHSSVMLTIAEYGECWVDDGRSLASFTHGVPDSLVLAACFTAATGDPSTPAPAPGTGRDEVARLRSAWASARRRAARRQPHEREGLIFHLERRVQRLGELVRVVTAAAEVTLRRGEEDAAEAYRLREQVGHLQARVRELEAPLGDHARPCGRELSTGAPCPDHPKAEPSADRCRQNLLGEGAVPGPHFRPDPDGTCTFCDGRTYVFNAESVNRTVKHAHRHGLTVCRGRRATDPMPDDLAATLPLCGTCRQGLLTPDPEGPDLR